MEEAGTGGRAECLGSWREKKGRGVEVLTAISTWNPTLHLLLCPLSPSFRIPWRPQELRNNSEWRILGQVGTSKHCIQLPKVSTEPEENKATAKVWVTDKWEIQLVIGSSESRVKSFEFSSDASLPLLGQ